MHALCRKYIHAAEMIDRAVIGVVCNSPNMLTLFGSHYIFILAFVLYYRAGVVDVVSDFSVVPYHYQEEKGRQDPVSPQST